MAFIVYKQFKFFWILFTVALLVSFSYINWRHNAANSFNFIKDVTNNRAHNIDRFINNVFQNIYKIPVYQQNNLNCKDDFDPYLQHIVINHPQISGLAIHDQKHHITCSTLPQNQTFNLNHDISLSIMGPLKTSMFIEPIYVIPKKIGIRNVEMIVLAPVLQKELNNPESGIHTTTLYDVNQKKEIIQIRKPTSNSWIDKLPIITDRIFASAKLNSIDGVVLTVEGPDQTLINNLLYNQILLILDILVFSISLYFLIKNKFNKYYSLHGAIKQAIKSGQFYPVYQPLFDTQCNTYSGAEVLLRWQDHGNEIIMPDLFIEEAEDTGLIVPITLQIIEIAFKEAKNILETQPDFHLAFNICALHFTDNQFFPQFYTLMLQYAISPKQILFEITERNLLDMNNEIYFNRLNELRNIGYSLAIDDYGTGHSSISYLQHYPFNFLKIDKLFIHAIGTKAVAESLNDAIIQLAKSINLTIIAEGVETKEQLDYLLQNEVRLIQGWYFSKALHVEQLIELLQGEKK
ncbi:EAL domain-containing protein [Fluoribacter gormanii]|uniref:EAL domain-containing protein n=1 Tax=Fluoribacter gormanii TaxID=464 RepID=UPI0022436915|nr:EAL domain-containing protein [Fluoribacter gormanii]MCW8443726.1 EAL domain-containing protein [Fluoribacter gormanii]